MTTAPLTGRHAVVTGAARGIGRACAVRLAELGADVAVVDIDLSSGRHYDGEPDGTTDEQIRQLGARALGIEADLGIEAEAHAAVRSALDAWGGLDVLVNVAGGAVTPFERSRPTQAPVQDIRKLIDVNLMSTIHCCQAAAPALRMAESAAIVNVASTAAFSVFPDGSNAAYAMTKAAVVHWTRHLAAELGADGVRVNLLAPGITLTGRVVAESSVTGYASRAQEVPLGRLGTPGDCADVMEFLVTDRSRFVTGRCIPVDGGWVLSAS
jgi:3-oxoacyl-[acyl-carrier protein] reductase